jgi:hypothetical protein
MLFIKNTQRTIAPHVYALDIAAKPPGKTFEIFMAVDGMHLPQEFLTAIEALGFIKKGSSAYTHNDGKQVMDLHYHKTGTDIFGGWNDAERATNLQDLQQVFGRFGLEMKPRTMSLAEAFK